MNRLALVVSHCCYTVRHWGHRWHYTLWPLLTGQRLGASTTSAFSTALQGSASGHFCHLGFYGHPQPAPIWQVDTDTAGRGYYHLPLI